LYHLAYLASAAGMCVPCMSIMQRTLVVSCRKRSKIQIFFRVYKTSVQIFQRVKVPYTSRWLGKVLASRKAAWGNPYAEGSETAKSGTDEQERYRRLWNGDKQPRPCKVHNANQFIVDTAGIGGRKMLLPGEIQECW